MHQYKLQTRGKNGALTHMAQPTFLLATGYTRHGNSRGNSWNVFCPQSANEKIQKKYTELTI